jgi:hypothetical protein
MCNKKKYKVTMKGTGLTVDENTYAPVAYPAF